MARSTPQLPTRAAAALALLGLLACASGAAERSLLPVLGPEDTDPAAGYERPPVLRARDILPLGVREGPYHRVQDEVGTDGFIHLYAIDSDFGVFPAYGDAMLRTRIREIEALATLEEMRRSQEFTAAVTRGLQSPFVATWKLIREPVDTIRGVPGDAWNAIRNTAELGRGERSEYEARAFREFIGFERRKREVALRLGVDPYSSNPVLQRELNRFAWASYAGGLPFLWVPSSKQAPAAPELGSQAEKRMGELLLLESPEDLRRLNHIELAVMGVPDASIAKFLSHPWYSPRHRTLLIGALATLDGARDREVFVQGAMRAGAEFDAVFFQRKAEMLRAYHEHVAPIDAIVAVERAIAATTRDGRLLLPVEVDHLVWTRPTARFLQSFTDHLPATFEPGQVVVLLSGTVSTRARGAIEALGFRVEEHAFQSLASGALAASHEAR